MDYTSALRRRSRAAGRLVRASITPAAHRDARAVAAYWWDGHANFGDALTPWLLPHFGVVPVLVPPERAQLVGVGSILEHLPSDFSGVTWGSGLIREQALSLPQVTALVVRGALTRERLGLSEEVALGDAGLLASRIIRRPRVRHRIGLVPHGAHDRDPDLLAFVATHPEVRVISTASSPRRVIGQIASCETILSTSLHGLIIADAYGIPAAWATAASEELMGGTFKFLDHESVVTPGRTRRVVLRPGIRLSDVLAGVGVADARRVASSQRSLIDAVSRIPTIRKAPLWAWQAR